MLPLRSFASCVVTGAALAGAVVIATLSSSALGAQVAPSVEVVLPFDSAGRITVLTPVLASRLRLAAPAWPVADAFRDARLLRRDDGGHVLSVQRPDGAFARYPLDPPALLALQRAVNDGVERLASTRPARADLLVGSGLELSQPAGNAFVRNQALLGLVAYGPAAAALLSDTDGAAAGAAYFFAAGGAFFTAANLVKQRPVTRAQASRAAHGGTRGALAGLATARILGMDGAPAGGAAVLAGAIGGSVAGFQQARGLTDGEAGSAGLFADLGALTTLGAGGATGAFRERRRVVVIDPNNPQFGSFTTTDNSLQAAGRVTLAAAVGAQIIGYTVGPRYARRASYNVTAGDADMVLTSAVLGATALGSVAGGRARAPEVLGAATAGLLGGALFGDRVFVRRGDRSAADGTLARVGAVAGALMGAGFAAMAGGDGRLAVGLASTGGVLGLLAADHLIAPPKDAGPLRGMVQSSSHPREERVRVSIGPVTAVRITF